MGSSSQLCPDIKLEHITAYLIEKIPYSSLLLEIKLSAFGLLSHIVKINCEGELYSVATLNNLLSAGDGDGTI